MDSAASEAELEILRNDFDFASLDDTAQTRDSYACSYHARMQSAGASGRALKQTGIVALLVVLLFLVAVDLWLLLWLSSAEALLSKLPPS